MRLEGDDRQVQGLGDLLGYRTGLDEIADLHLHGRQFEQQAVSVFVSLVQLEQSIFQNIQVAVADEIGRLFAHR